MKYRIILGENTDAIYNLAFEEYLQRYSEEREEGVLYLWQNKNAIILGRNQNAYVEVDLRKAEEQKVQIIRRMTGGGAVYHDLGNLNFTIILPKKLYNVRRTSHVIQEALGELDIAVELSGRNDMLVNGYKFSGNAYYSNDKSGMHHGTILLSADLDKMEKLLTVSADKLQGKGIKSVRSRVKNLSEIQPGLTIDQLIICIRKAFIKEFCKEDKACLVSGKLEVKQDILDALITKYASDEWNFNKVREYTFSDTVRFSWGSVTISFEMEAEHLKSVKVFSDSLYPDLIDKVNVACNSININNADCIKMLREDIDMCGKEADIQDEILGQIENLYISMLKRIEV